jgi:hypothetical protein
MYQQDRACGIMSDILWGVRVSERATAPVIRKKP